MDCRNLHTVWILDSSMLSCLWKQLPWLPVTFLHWLLHSRQPFALRDSVTRFLTQLFCLTNSTWAPFEKIPNFFPFCEDKLRNSQFFCENEKISSNCFCLFTFSVHMGPIQSFFFKKSVEISWHTVPFMSCFKLLPCCLLLSFPPKTVPCYTVVLLRSCLWVSPPGSAPLPPALLTSVDLIPAPP